MKFQRERELEEFMALLEVEQRWRSCAGTEDGNWEAEASGSRTQKCPTLNVPFPFPLWRTQLVSGTEEAHAGWHANGHVSKNGGHGRAHVLKCLLTLDRRMDFKIEPPAAVNKADVYTRQIPVTFGSHRALHWAYRRCLLRPWLETF